MSHVGSTLTSNMKARVAATRRILAEAGVDAAALPVLAHADDTGTRPDVLVASAAHVHPALLRYLAAHHGLLHGTPRVVAFNAHPDGPDKVHVIHAGVEQAQAFDTMRKAGFPRFSVHKNVVYLFDPGGDYDLSPLLGPLNASQYHALAGHGRVIGAGEGADAADGRAAYRDAIRSAEAVATGSAGGGTQGADPAALKLARVEDMVHGVDTTGGHHYQFDAGGHTYVASFVPHGDEAGKYEAVFERDDPTLQAAGVSTHALGDVGHGAVDVFRSVGEALHHFVTKARPKQIRFSATNREGSRVRLYGALAERIAKRYGGHALHQPLQHATYYTVHLPEKLGRRRKIASDMDVTFAEDTARDLAHLDETDTPEAQRQRLLDSLDWERGHREMFDAHVKHTGSPTTRAVGYGHLHLGTHPQTGKVHVWYGNVPQTEAEDTQLYERRVQNAAAGPPLRLHSLHHGPLGTVGVMESGGKCFLHNRHGFRMGRIVGYATPEEATEAANYIAWPSPPQPKKLARRPETVAAHGGVWALPAESVQALYDHATGKTILSQREVLAHLTNNPHPLAGTLTAVPPTHVEVRRTFGRPRSYGASEALRHLMRRDIIAPEQAAQFYTHPAFDAAAPGEVVYGGYLAHFQLYHEPTRQWLSAVIRHPSRVIPEAERRAQQRATDKVLAAQVLRRLLPKPKPKRSDDD